MIYPTLIHLPLIAALASYVLLPVAADGSGKRFIQLSPSDDPSAQRNKFYYPASGSADAPKSFALTIEVDDQGKIADGKDFKLDVEIGGETKKPSCSLSGTLKDGVDSTTFKFADGPQYLSHCGAQDGITVTCKDPPSLC